MSLFRAKPYRSICPDFDQYWDTAYLGARYITVVSIPSVHTPVPRNTRAQILSHEGTSLQSTPRHAVTSSVQQQYTQLMHHSKP